MNTRELQFAEVFTKRGLTLVAQPCRFWLAGIRQKYSPDFFCVEEDTYYEVSGSRQAHSQGRARIVLMAREYSHIKFRVVKPNGEPYREIKKKKRLCLPRVIINNSITPTPLKGLDGTARTARIIEELRVHSGNISATARAFYVEGTYLNALIRQCPKTTAELVKIRKEKHAKRSGNGRNR